MGGSPFAYSRLLEQIWQDQESALIIEHDIELNARVLRQAMHCSCEWGISPYKGIGTDFHSAGLLTVSLGCTRFRSSLMKRFPQAIAEANAIDDNGSICPPGHYLRLDGRVHHVLMRSGYEPHRHDLVTHHHLYAYGCSCGEDPCPSESTPRT